MNDEIKEILEDIDSQDLPKEQLLLIKDYITNLQQRIGKAIEFVETNPLIWKPNMELTNLIENPKLEDMLYYAPDEWLHKLHTILKGEDENEKK